MSKNIVLLLVLVGVAVVVGNYLVKHDDDGALGVGSPAADFSAIAVDGQVIRLSELRGKVVVLDFWATWCPPCRAMIPDERELVQRMQGQPLVFLGISADDNVDTLRNFVRTQNMNWTHILDGPQGPLQKQFEIEGLPTIFVLDATGVIRFKAVGQQPAGRIEQVVAKLLGQAR
jgi:peroxiredoxin